jgi:hypothetical protein
MTINDLSLTEYDLVIHKNEVRLKQLMRDGEKAELRKAYKAIFDAAFHAIQRLDQYERT